MKKQALLVIAIKFLLTVLIISACQTSRKNEFDRVKTEIVQKILTARETNKPIPSIKKAYPDLTINQAYEVQALLTDELIKKYGPVAGYKLGYADSSSLINSGLEIPAYGPLFKKQIRENGGVIPLHEYRNFSIECEVVFVIGRVIDKPVADIKALRPYIKAVSIGYDMGEGIFDGPSTVEDFIVNGAGAKYFMIAKQLNPDEIDAPDLHLTISFQGEKIYNGKSRTVLGNPWYALLDVANDLHKRRRPLKENDLIFTGKLDAAYKPEPDKAAGIYYGNGGPLGEIQCMVK